jgi:NADPH-dependent 2,4-dienoyl-CoA reductase/sulfur reductase-like enzyme
MDSFNPRAQYGLELIRKFQDKIHGLYSIPPVILPLEHPKEKIQPRVCIIGAGTAGLYTAMLLDWIRTHLGVTIPYDIFEASPRDGGRVWTHHFSGAEFDYYVSALLSI